MSIRVKLTLVLTLCVTVTTALSSLWFLQLQKRNIRAMEGEKTRMLAENAVRMGSESLLAKDSLMLLDYLSFLKRVYPEVQHARVHANGKWMDVGPAQQEDPERYELLERKVAEPLSVQLWLKKAMLQKRLEDAERAARRQVLFFAALLSVAGFFFAVLLGGSLTRRITEIQKAMKTVGEGRWTGEIRRLGNDEIGALARGFNEMQKKLMELDEMKKTFVASVTHELRSPLGAISTHVRRILSGPAELSGEVRGSLERIQENTSRLDLFVSNLLEMSKIEKGKLQFDPVAANPGEVAENTAIFYKPRASELGLQLQWEIGKDLPILRMDPNLIGQVLANLISNALKFTRPPGQVRLSVQQRKDQVVFSVQDSGIGLSAEDLKRLFVPFERIANPVKASGTGLGLAISKAIIDMHHGEIGAESALGKGSRFYFSLPVR